MDGSFEGCEFELFIDPLFLNQNNFFFKIEKSLYVEKLLSFKH